MLIAVAGVPSPHFNEFQRRLGRLAGSGHTMFGVPCRPQNGACRLGGDDADALMARANALINKTPRIAADGFGVICLAHQWDNIGAFEAPFFPSSLVLRVDLPHPVLSAGEEGRTQFNAVSRAIETAAPILIRAIRAVASEAAARRNRSPILLPLRSFASDQFRSSIERLSAELLDAERPSDRIWQACDEIEAVHPFNPKGVKGFLDDANVIFRSPGRDLHGQVWDQPGEGHAESCSLNGRFRLGGPIATGFHYDCMRLSKLEGDFSNCHGKVATYEGRPHLNIAPNDFVRA
ncbi:hypothetical protein D3C72_404620 [compost metagenome]